MINKRSDMTLDFVVDDGTPNKIPFEMHIIWRDATYGHVIGLQEKLVGFFEQLNSLGGELIDSPDDASAKPKK